MPAVIRANFLRDLASRCLVVGPRGEAEASRLSRDFPDGICNPQTERSRSSRPPEFRSLLEVGSKTSEIKSGR